MKREHLDLVIETLEERRNLAAFSFDASEALVLSTGEDSTTTFRLRGSGEGVVKQDANSDSFSVEFHSTTDRSSLQITTRGNEALLSGLDGSSLRSFKAKNIRIEDAVVNFHEGVDRIQVDAVARSEIFIGDHESTAGYDDVRLVMSHVSDSQIESERIIRSARADSVIDTDNVTDTIEAAAIERFRVRGEMQAELEATSWIASLPLSVRRGIQWSADHEEGSLEDWHQGGGENAGGGIFNTGDDEVEAVVSTVVAHSGRYSARATITGAYQQTNGNRAVRLMRWTNRPWDDGGDIFDSPSYFSTWMYIPEDYDPDSYDPVNGGWWNVFQFKSDDAEGVSQPMFSMNIGVNESGEMVPYLWAAQLGTSVDASADVVIRSGEWVHFEAYYKSSADNRGRVTLFQNGQEIIDLNRVQTVLPGGDESVVWGLGNYTNHIDGGEIPGEATIYFDDAVVSRSRVSRFLD